ncbi:efflux RND transporter periplasmic adaptor subunit [Acidobacteriota bacterium]
MKKKKWLFLAAAAVVIVIAVVLFLILRGNGNNTVKYKTEEVKKGTIEAVVSTTGTVTPVTLVEVGSQVSGRIAKIHVDFNSQVKAGQVVAEIDPSQIMTRIKQNEANYESSKASLQKAKVNSENIAKQYQRSLQLFEKKLISFEEKESVEAQYLGAKSDVRSAEAHLLQSKSQLDSTKVDLDYSVIKSPIDGVVISRNVNVGQTVAASFQAPVLFTIANDLGKMQVECSIDEADIGKIKEGQDARFTVDAFPDEEFKGKVSQVRYSPEVIQNVVTYTTIVAVDNPGLKLRPGMTATVTIVAGKAEGVLMVPASATRFTPPLSQEEMMALFQKMRDEMMKRRGMTPGAGSGQPGQPGRQGAGMGFFGGSRPGGDSSQRKRQATRVWILEENGQVKPVFIRTGVTDDSNIEVIRGQIKEGQLVITGILSGPANQDQSNTNRMRGMGMMFRR